MRSLFRSGGQTGRHGAHALALALEPRLMFDAAVATTAAHAAPDAAAKALIPTEAAPVEVHAADPARDGGKKEAAFVDTTVSNWQALVTGLENSNPGIEIDLIAKGDDGLAQIAAWAETHSGYDSIQIFSEGSQGTFSIGGESINAGTVDSATGKAELAQIGSALNSGGEILLYGTDIGAGTNGQALLDKMADETGAVVVATDHDADDSAQGGDKSLSSDTGADTGTLSTVEVQAANAALNGGKTEVTFIDTSVSGWETLVAEIQAQNPGMGIELIDGTQDGLAQIAAWAATQSGIDAIHILSHGTEGTLYLGSDVLTDASLSDSTIKGELATIGEALSADGDLLLYGCDVAEGSAGQQFIDDLATATGADVAASNDLTGAASSDGDWSLERSTGSIDVSSLDLAGYDGVLSVTGSTVNVYGTDQTTQYDSGTGTVGTVILYFDLQNTLEFSTTNPADNLYFYIDTSQNPQQIVFVFANSQSLDVSFDLVFGGASLASIDSVTKSGSSTSSATLTASVVTTGTYANKAIQFDVGAGATGDGTVIFTITSTNTGSAPTTTVSSAALSADSGTAGDFITNTAAQTISGTLSSALATGEKVEVSYDGGATWSDASSYSVGSTSWSTTTTLSGSSTFEARVTNADGSSTAYTHTYTLDTTAPTAPTVTGISTDTGTSSTDHITSDQTLIVSGTAEANATVTVYKDGSSIGTATADGSGNWSFDYTGTTLAEGTTVFTAKATDAAGNDSTLSSALSVTVDTTAPAAPTVTGISTDTGTSSTDHITTDQTLIVSGTAEANSTVTVYKDGSSIGTTTADGSGNWSFDYTGTTLAVGTYAFTAKATDAAGNVGSTSSALNVQIVTAPTAPTVTGISTDTGTSGTDHITSDQTLIVSGTAVAGATVTVYKDGSSIGTATADGSGNWSFDYTGTTLAGGTTAFTAMATVGGQDSALSSALSVTVDTTAPAAPTVTGISTDTGTSSTDHITTDQTLIVSGTAEANATVTVYKDGSSIGTATADGSGNWSFDYTGTTLAEGTTVFTAKATDTAGNDSTLSSALSVTVDTTAPSVSSVSVPSDGSYTAGNNLDFTVHFDEAVSVDTSGGTPRIALTLNTGGTVYASYVSGSGTSDLVFRYTVQAGNSDPDGVTVGALSANGGTLTDAAGNSATLTLNSVGSTAAVLIDTQAPDAPTLVSASSETSSTSVPLTGTAEANSTVKIYDGASLVGTATADGSGDWAYTAVLAGGVHSLTATATDAAGNVSPASSATSVTVTVAETQTEVPPPPPLIQQSPWQAPTASSESTGISGTVSSGAVQTILHGDALTQTQSGTPSQDIDTSPALGTTLHSVLFLSQMPLSPLLSSPGEGLFRVAVMTESAGAAIGMDAILVAKPIGEVDATNGRISFTIPFDAFAVTRADSAVTLSATAANGRPLPSWLSFNPRTGTFRGTPPPGEKTVEIRVVARDSQGHEASQVFRIVTQSGERGQRQGDARPEGWGPHLAEAGRPGLTTQLHDARLGGPARMAAMVHAARDAMAKAS